MRKMTVSFEIDLENPAEVEALNNMLDLVAVDSAPAPASTKKKDPVKTNITIDQLRELTKEKSSDTALRPKIKAKLKELGADTVTSLSEDKYEQYKSFIEKL